VILRLGSADEPDQERPEASQRDAAREDGTHPSRERACAMKIIAVDFDDTLFRYVPTPDGMRDFSGRLDSIGEPIWEWINWCQTQKAHGCRLILWTCREGLALEHAVEACRRVGLTFDAVNANLPEMCCPGQWPDSRKVKADLYLDDKARRTALELSAP
jgi:hypothetical protein